MSNLKFLCSTIFALATMRTGLSAELHAKYKIILPENTQLANITDGKVLVTAPKPYDFDALDAPNYSESFTWLALDPKDHEKKLWQIAASAAYPWEGVSSWTLKTEKPWAELDDDFQAAHFYINAATFKDLAGDFEGDKPNFEDSDSSSMISNSTKAWLQTIQRTYDIPGLAVSIVTSPSSNDHGITPAGRSHAEVLTFGSRNLQGDPLTSDSLFCLAGNTQLFTALSVGLLIDRNATLQNGSKLDWTTKIIDILPEWSMVDKHAENQATIHDLLVMTTGIPFHPYAPNHAEPLKLLKTLSHLPPSSQIRNKWQYSNDNYLVLSHIVSVISQQSFPDFVQENFLNPLGMTSALFDPIEAKKTGKRTDAILRIGQEMEVVSTNLDGKPTALQGKKKSIDWWTKGSGENMWGASGLIMSARDVTRWLEELLSPTVVPLSILGKCGEEHIPAENLILPDTVNSSYGHSQWISYHRGHKVLSQYGYQLGQHTLFVVLPEDGIAVAAMNLGDGIGSRVNRAIVYTLIDELLGLEKKDWQGDVLDVWVNEQVQAHKSRINEGFERSMNMEDLDKSVEGLYYHPAWGSLHLRRFRTFEDDLSLNQLLQAQTRLPAPSFVSPMPGREDWYILLHSTGPQYTWSIIQLHDNHTLTEVVENGIVRVLGSGSAAINQSGMGMFGGFWTYDSASFKHYTEGKDPKTDAEVWFERVD